MAKRLFSRQAYVLFTPGSGGQSINIPEATVFVVESGVHLYNKRRIGEGADDWGSAGWGASLRISVNVDAATPSNETIPDGVEGTIKVAKNKAALTTGYITGLFVFDRRTHSGNMGGGPGGARQVYSYTGRFVRDFTEVN